MKVKDVMSAKVASVSADASIQDAAEMMRDLKVGSLPVRPAKGSLDPIGIITDRDITCRCTADALDPTTTKVADVMSKPVISCADSDNVTDAARLMESKQVRRLPVYGKNGHLVGILALADIARDVPHELSGEIIEAVSKPPARKSAA